MTKNISLNSLPIFVNFLIILGKYMKITNISKYFVSTILKKNRKKIMPYGLEGYKPTIYRST